eukprot:15048-Heterococcus_DN1.PRE.4
MSRTDGKRVAAQAEGSRALENAGILQQVLLFVGPGYYLFDGIVNKAFHKCYASVPDRVVYLDDAPHTVTSGMTTMRAVCRSASCVQDACNAGLQLAVHNRALYNMIGSWASIPTLERAFQCGLQHTSAVCSGAAAAGDLPKLQWLHLEQGCPLDNEITEIAATHGDLDMLMWARSRGCEWQEECIADWAAQSRNLDMLNWLSGQKGIYFTSETMCCAADNGDLAMCQFLRAVGCEWNDQVTDAAACSGNLELLQWLLSNDCPLSDDFAHSAAGVSTVEVLTWLHETGLEFDGCCMQYAAKSGRLNNCKYLLSTGCPFTDAVCSEAALIGHFEVVRWAHQAGCPLIDGDEIAQHAARLGNLETLQYMQQQQIVWTAAELSELLNAAGAYEHLDVAKWLRQQGAQWPDALQHACRALLGIHLKHWKGETLVWARAEGCTSVLPAAADIVIHDPVED